MPGHEFEFVPTPLAFGGVVMFIDETLYYTILEKTSNEAFQALWSELRFASKKNIICGIIYRQHNWVRAQFGQSNFPFFQQKRKKDILLILIIFTYFKVRTKTDKKKMIRKIDHFFIFLILKSALKKQKIL